MSLFASISDPTDLDAIRSVVAGSPRADALISLDIERLVIAPDATLGVATELAAQLRRRGEDVEGAQILVATDATPIQRAGTDVKALVNDLLVEAGFTIQTLVLGDGEHSLHADDAALDLATSAAASVKGVVSVGSGTITDIAKVATSRAGDLPLVVVQTAASVDGYTDNVSVILRSGAKRTIPSRWPDVVLADTTTISTAPAQLNTAGMGEVLSLFTAPADWRLAHLLGMDDSYHETPRDLLLTYAGVPEKWAAGVSDGNVDAIVQLTRVLAIRGIGTGIAGTTACLSGVEHLVSHMLDMHAAARGLETGLHGAQVGVASLVAAAAWEHLAQRLHTEGPQPREIPEGAARAAVEAAFADVDPSGALAAECWADVSRKLDAIDSRADAVETVLADLPTLMARSDWGIGTVEGLATALRVSGAAALPRELQPWVSDEIWRWAVANCHRMRNRFTVVDLLDLLGWWEPADIDQVIERAHNAVTGAAA